jgi:hypothetical protein
MAIVTVNATMRACVRCKERLHVSWLAHRDTLAPEVLAALEATGAVCAATGLSDVCRTCVAGLAAALRERRERDKPRRLAGLWAAQSVLHPQATKYRITLVARSVGPWTDEEAITRLFYQAERKTERTGIPHAVEMASPPRKRTVCGLFVPKNLRIVRAPEKPPRKIRAFARR